MIRIECGALSQTTSRGSFDLDWSCQFSLVSKTCVWLIAEVVRHNEWHIVDFIQHNRANFVRLLSFTLKRLMQTHTVCLWWLDQLGASRRRDCWLAYGERPMSKGNSTGCPGNHVIYERIARDRERKRQDVGAMKNKNKEPDTKVQEGTSLVCTTPSFPSVGLYRVTRPCACHDNATSSPAQTSRLV